MKKYDFLDYSKEVLLALKENRPVVALESTIISHGMPYPENINTALKLESIIRENSAVPAVLAVIKGKIKAGLSVEELEHMAKSKNILKASRRDLPVIIARKLDAATTVSATMICADLAGIKVFATGGVGGVHRGAEKSFDISADLQELAKTDVAVVSAGVKSILDIGLTLEYLETMGVPVIGYRTDEFPAFYTRQSGFKVNYKMNTPEEIAGVLKTKWKMGIKGGVLIANPIPEKDSMDQEIINSAIEKAVSEAVKNNIKGKSLTPFLLDKINELTHGESLKANISLVCSNALAAAQIAGCL